MDRFAEHHEAILKVSDVVNIGAGAALVTHKFWVDWLHDVNAILAEYTPTIGFLWIVVQLGMALWRFWKGKL